MLATTPSGSWPIRSRMPPSSNTVSSRESPPRPASRKKSMRPSKPVQLVARLRDRLADLGGQRARRASRARRTTRGAKALRSQPRARPAACAAQAGCAARARAALAATLAASSAGSFGDQRAGGGVVDLQQVRSCVSRRGGARGARGSRRGSARRRACLSPRAVELGVPLHRGHVARPGASGSPRRCRRLGQRASTTKPRREVLDAPGGGSLLIVACATPG